MHDQGTGVGRVVHASFSLQMSYGQEGVRLEDFVSSLRNEVREVENAASLTVLLMVDDFV